MKIQGQVKRRPDLADQLREDRVCLMYVTLQDSSDVNGID
jgi:hypothetical protein